MEKHNSLYQGNRRKRPMETRISNAYDIYSQPITPDDTPGKREKTRLSGRLPGTSFRKQKKLPTSSSEPAPPRRSNRSKNKRKSTRYNQLISYGTAVSSRTHSSTDTEREEFIPELHSEPRKPTSVSRAIPAAIPITRS
jgi:hypothetical protein